MTTPLSEERIAEMRNRLSQTEPLYYCQLTGSEVHSLLAEVERLRDMLGRVAASDQAARASDRKRGDLLVEAARRIAELVKVLRKHQWIGDFHYSYRTCLECGHEEPRHAPDCALDAALRRGE